MQREMFGPLGKLQYKEYAKDIHDSGVHLLKIINDILDLSKIEAGKFELNEEDCDVPRLVRDAVRFVAERADSAGQVLLVDVQVRPDAVLKHDAVAGVDGTERGIELRLVGDEDVRSARGGGCADQRSEEHRGTAADFGHAKPV